MLLPLSVPRVVQILAGRGHIELERELHKVYRMFLEGQASLVKLKGLSPQWAGLTTVTFLLLPCRRGNKVSSLQLHLSASACQQSL